MKIIHLTKGKFCIVDDQDYEWLSQWKWYVSHHDYAMRDTGSKNNKAHIRMHRLIMSTPEGMETDHINGDKLDNRRCNLRICTKTQNMWNSAPRKNTSSKYKGVSWNKSYKKWQSYSAIKGDKINLGYFTSEIEAAAAYNEFAVKNFGEFARLNDISAYGAGYCVHGDLSDFGVVYYTLFDFSAKAGVSFDYRSTIEKAHTASLRYCHCHLSTLLGKADYLEYELHKLKYPDGIRLVKSGDGA